jgi:hypothetical protein
MASTPEALVEWLGRGTTRSEKLDTWEFREMKDCDGSPSIGEKCSAMRCTSNDEEGEDAEWNASSSTPNTSTKPRTNKLAPTLRPNTQ